MQINTLKSIWAVFAGLLVVVILSIVTDTVLEQSGVFPSYEEQSKYGFHNTWMLLLAFAYRSIYTLFGGYTTAKLAPSRSMLHVLILGIVGTVAGTIGIFVGWNLSDHWYPIALAVTALPLTWLGGKLNNK